MWRPDDPQCNESAKIKYDTVPYTRGRGLDIGCGPNKAFPHFIGVDNRHDSQEFGIEINPDVSVDDATNLPIFASSSMDFVFSSHLLEHIEKPQKALKEWWRLIRPGGYLVLYLPDDGLYPKVGEKGANPDHKHNLSRPFVTEWMKGVGSWDLLENELRDHDNGPGEYGNEYSFYQVYRKISPRGKENEYRFSCMDSKPEKTACVVRYGGFGDMIQASTVLPYLKAEGYQITVMTTPRGAEMLRANPHVDNFIIQDTDQVPNNELSAFWSVWRQKFDRFINLSESVEGTLLALPGRTMHDWPGSARHFMLDYNYLEVTHAIAEIPKKDFQAYFFPDYDEIKWAKSEAKAINPGGKPVILWSLAGSSVHKAWPHLDQVIARIMLKTDAIVVLVGDEYCKILEQGWEKEDRVFLRSGEWNIRQSLTFAKTQSDLVIGTETGLLNAVGLEPVHKIITLSHSSPENLTKHWLNVQALVPDVPCFPCHQMHYGFVNCHRDEETGCAICQSEISADDMWDAILNWMEALKLKEAV